MKTRFFPLFFGLLIFSLLACDKPQQNEDDLGPESSPSEIERAQGDAISGVQPSEIQVGETAHYTETQELITSEGPVVRLLREWTIEVIEKEVLDVDLLEFTTIRSSIDHDEDSKPISKFKDVFVFLGLPAEAKKDVAGARLSLKLMNSESPAKIEEELSIVKVSFHNLAATSAVLQPPEKVQQRPDCGGIPDCKIDGRRITYDVVFRFSDNSIQKHQIEWLISNKVPFFSSILKQCATTLVKVDSLRVLVKQCQNAVDFTFSADDTPAS